MYNQIKFSWVAALLLSAVSGFAFSRNEQCPPGEPGHEMDKTQLLSAYNIPARILLNDSFDVYATGSFLYWQARQENMEIGLISRNDAEDRLDITSGGDAPFSTSYVNNTSISYPNFTFRPGFKFGFGVNMGWDNWDAYGEYTWFHGTIYSGVKSLPVSSATSVPTNGEYLYPMQGAPVTNPSTKGLYFQNANQYWNLKIDFLDLSLARSYYSGTKLTMRPFFGVRGAWIRQNITTFYGGSPGYLTASGQNNQFVTDYSASWGVGPRTGFESNWMLGYGLRFIGNGSGDVLYTRYHVQQSQQAVTIAPESGNPILSNSTVSQEVDYLRTHLDLELGLGWGMYLNKQHWHLDFAATYGFQVFWDQNMFRNFTNTTAQAYSFNPNGNLYIHGLTLNGRFDF